MSFSVHTALPLFLSGIPDHLGPSLAVFKRARDQDSSQWIGEPNDEESIWGATKCFLKEFTMDERAGLFTGRVGRRSTGRPGVFPSRVWGIKSEWISFNFPVGQKLWGTARYSADVFTLRVLWATGAISTGPLGTFAAAQAILKVCRFNVIWRIVVTLV